MKVVFVHNFCTHYTRPVFELLSRLVDIDYYFFSKGQEWYWQTECGALSGEFKHEYLEGFPIGRTRVTLSLVSRLLRTNYDVYIKCINGRFALPVTFAIAKLRGKPFILRTGIWMRIQTRTHRLAFPITRYIYRKSDAFVVYGEHVKRYLMSEGVDASRIFVAPHAVENAHYSRIVSESEKSVIRDRLRLSPQAKVVLYLGRLEEIKGVSYLIRAFAEVKDPDAVLVFVGSGSEQESMKALVNSLGLEERVRFAGHVTPADTIPYYAIAYCKVLPSIAVPTGKEPWGLVVNEAFNQGVPVIATDAVGAVAGGLLVDRVNGMVVPEQNVAAIRDSLNELLADKPLRERLSQEASRIVRHWTPEKMAKTFFEAILFVLQKRQVQESIPKSVPDYSKPPSAEANSGT